MDILAKARQLEAKLARTVDRAASRVMAPGNRAPLEISHAVVEAVEHEVQPAGRGRQLFPFNRIHVRVVASTPQVQARFEATFAMEPTLAQRIRARLESASYAPADLAVDVSYVDAAGDGWSAPDMHVEFERLDAPPMREPSAAPAAVVIEEPVPGVEIEVAAGEAAQASYSFDFPRIDLGRCVEVRDRRNQLVRRNHVVFADTDDAINRTVSRRHAHLDYSAGERAYRVYDDGSEQGTAVARGGKTISVPPGARGVRLQPGDEILLGHARLKLRVVART